MTFRNDDSFDEAAALKHLLDTYGQSPSTAPAVPLVISASGSSSSSAIDISDDADGESGVDVKSIEIKDGVAVVDETGRDGKDKTPKKRAARSLSPVKTGSKGKSKAAKVDNDEEDGSAKKLKKVEMVAKEENRAIAEAIKEMADIYFKNKDARKGGQCPVSIFFSRK